MVVTFLCISTDGSVTCSSASLLLTICISIQLCSLPHLILMNHSIESQLVGFRRIRSVRTCGDCFLAFQPAQSPTKHCAIHLRWSRLFSQRPLSICEIIIRLEYGHYILNVLMIHVILIHFIRPFALFVAISTFKCLLSSLLDLMRYV